MPRRPDDLAGRTPPSNTDRRASRTRAIALLSLPPLIFLGCSGEKKPPPEAKAAPVIVAPARREAVPVEVRGVGTVEPLSSVSIKSRVSGALVKVAFTEGQDVEEGDLLFRIDPRPFEAALREAEATTAKDRAQAEQAAVDARRYRAAYEAGVASRQDAETREATARALQAMVQADLATVASARLQLQYATIRSPVSGRTGAIQVREGNMVTADTTVLVVIDRMHPVFVSFAVPQARLPEVQRFMAQGPLAVSAQPPADARPPPKGEITFVDNAVDRATGTIRLKGTFPNDDLRLWPGQLVQVTLTLTTRPDAIVVPSAAVQAGQQGSYVFVVKPDLTADLRPVTVGDRIDGGRLAVIDRGVAEGEQVVTEGHLRLAPGARVTIAGARDAGIAEGRP